MTYDTSFNLYVAISAPINRNNYIVKFDSSLTSFSWSLYKLPGYGRFGLLKYDTDNSELMVSGSAQSNQF